MSRASPQASRARLPARWADEMARASSTTGATTAPGDGFDARLDDFLRRFHAELVAARAAKDNAAADSDEFRVQMARVQDMYVAEGRDFADALERRNPAFATATAAYGENTLELARGIERLELAVHQEETKRVVIRRNFGPAERSTSRGAPGENPGWQEVHPWQSAGCDNVSERSHQQQHVRAGLGKPQNNAHLAHAIDRTKAAGCFEDTDLTTHTLSNLHSDETLCLMQGDIHALKLELMRLQRSKAGGGSGARPSSPMRSSETPFTLSTVSPIQSGDSAAHGVIDHGTVCPPGYLSHLEQMKSRLEALERKPLSRPTGEARKRSQARIARTRTLTDLYANASAGVQDENTSPNIMRRARTPPRERKRTSMRSLGNEPWLEPKIRNSNVVKTIVDDGTEFCSPSHSQSSSPSPLSRRNAFRDGASTAIRNGNDDCNARRNLFSIDAPEELLNRPQSQAAARDIQRYSLRVARRLGPVQVPEYGSHGEQSAPSRANDRGPTFNGSDFQPDERYRATARTRVGKPGTSIQQQTNPNRRPVDVDENSSRAGERNGQISQKPSRAPVDNDDVGSATGSGQVVEEMEGDIWVRRGNLWKRWRLRYASIVSHQFFGRVLCLFSYDSSKQIISSKSEIIVLHNALCRALRQTVDIAGEIKQVFALRTAQEYYFATSSDLIRKQWVREIRRAARIENPRTTPESAVNPPAIVQEAPVRTQKAAGSSKVHPVGRSVTHTGVQPQATTQNGGIPRLRSKRGPFRRPTHQ